MITKEQEAECSKSKLYFKDPGTGDLLTGSEPRVAGPSADSGKFIYPQITVSTGDVVKLSYTLWTEEEKQIYKDYRAKGKSNPRPKKPKAEQTECDDSPAEIPAHVSVTVAPVEYDNTSAIGEDSKNVLAICDTFNGLWQFAGITYALLSCKSEPRKIYHIPRSVIDNETFNALCKRDEA